MPVSGFIKSIFLLQDYRIIKNAVKLVEGGT
jgi:hypothetical protein